MPRNIRVKPGKGSSLAGLIGGIIFLIIGFTIVIPIFGWFGVLWTLVALVITIVNGVNAFSAKGVPIYEVTMSGDGKTQDADFAVQLRDLKELKDDGIITETEYNIKREEILNKKW
jgi:hypothetical protein